MFPSPPPSWDATSAKPPPFFFFLFLLFGSDSSLSPLWENDGGKDAAVLLAKRSAGYFGFFPLLFSQTMVTFLDRSTCSCGATRSRISINVLRRAKLHDSREGGPLVVPPAQREGDTHIHGILLTCATASSRRCPLSVSYEPAYRSLRPESTFSSCKFSKVGRRVGGEGCHQYDLSFSALTEGEGEHSWLGGTKGECTFSRGGGG